MRETATQVHPAALVIYSEATKRRSVTALPIVRVRGVDPRRGQLVSVVRPLTRQRTYVRIWTPPRLQARRLFGFRGTTAHVYPASNCASNNRCRAMMGYSRASSRSLFRPLRPWTLLGFADVGSTCEPSNGLPANRGRKSLRVMPRPGPAHTPFRSSSLRVRDPGMGALVQPSAAVRTDRQRSTRRARGKLLSFNL